MGALRLTQKVRARHTNAVSVVRYRQDGNVDRVASVQGFGGNDVGGGSNPQQLATGQHRNTVGAGESLFGMMGRQQYAQSAPLGKAANSIENSHLVPKIKARHRLVKNQDPRFLSQSAGERGKLSLATADSQPLAVGQMPDPQSRYCPSAALRSAVDGAAKAPRYAVRPI